MVFEFETLACRVGNGNMKGGMMNTMPDDAVMLSGAEMDFPTAPCIREALSNFAENGLYGYTLPDEEYRATVCRWMQLARSWSVLPEQIVPTMGTIAGLCTAVRAFTNPGDGVIIQHPSYYRFDRAVEKLGRQVLSNPLIETEGVYSLDFTDLEEKMSMPESRLMVLCNPHNPTGKVFRRDDLLKIAELANRYNVLVFSDEIFAETAWENVLPYASVDPVCGITSTSLGKSFNFTGVNQANVIIPNAQVREAYLKQRNTDHFGSIDPFFYTALRAAYTEDGLEWIEAVKDLVQENYRMLKETLAAHIPVFSLSPMDGAYIAWMDCRRLGLDDCRLREFLEHEALLFADPGEEYGPGGSGFYRLNLATPKKQIKMMLDNLIAAMQRNGFG